MVSEMYSRYIYIFDLRVGSVGQLQGSRRSLVVFLRYPKMHHTKAFITMNVRVTVLSSLFRPLILNFSGTRTMCYSTPSSLKIFSWLASYALEEAHDSRVMGRAA